MNKLHRLKKMTHKRGDHSDDFNDIEPCDCQETKKNYLLSYEIIALMFYNDTGLMAPGKSVSPVMMDSRYQDGSRETAWQKWQELNKSHIKAVMELV